MNGAFGAWLADPRTPPRLRRAATVLFVAAVVAMLAKGGGRPADPYLKPAAPVPATAAPGG